MKSHFGEAKDAGNMLNLTVANGIYIPNIGYFEIDVERDGVVVPQRGILVPRDLGSDPKKKQVPGTIGTNVLQHIEGYAAFFLIVWNKKSNRYCKDLRQRAHQDPS